MIPSTEMTRNQTRQTGPKKAATLAVPWDCTRNRATRMVRLMTITTAGVTSWAMAGTVRSPSTADSTEIAGVIMASP